MPDGLPPTPDKAKRLLLIWAVAAIVFVNIALVLWMRGRRGNMPSRQLAQTTTNLSFSSLTDGDVAGRYRLFEEANEVGIITLLPDHTMINKDGTTFRQYHWEIQPDGLLTVWQRTELLFNVIEKPGVYILRRSDGTDYRRIEKVQE